MAKLFEPWILVLNTDDTRYVLMFSMKTANVMNNHLILSLSCVCHSHPRCSPWLESDATAAASLVSLYAHLTETLHEKSKGKHTRRQDNTHIMIYSAIVYNIFHPFVNNDHFMFVVVDRLLPGQRGALWLHLMHYCETCTSPKMPEYLLYTYHTEYSRLPWKDLHPDQTLMRQFFNVRNPSNKPSAVSHAYGS